MVLNAFPQDRPELPAAPLVPST